jgi:ribosomal protein S12 methylthiotransferase accessory factor
MEMKITFPGNLKVDAACKGFTVRTDQPVSGGGDGSAPGPAGLSLRGGRALRRPCDVC